MTKPAAAVRNSKGTTTETPQRFAPGEVLMSLLFMFMLPLVILCLRIGESISAKTAWLTAGILFAIGFIIAAGDDKARAYWREMSK
ncbi:MAG: hypothetical protein RIQ56_302 [Candidatus Parcubacteria bacterium]|jgi:hypothetical protein